jgi:hypothetical protein
MIERLLANKRSVQSDDSADIPTYLNCEPT